MRHFSGRSRAGVSYWKSRLLLAIFAVTLSLGTASAATAMVECTQDTYLPAKPGKPAVDGHAHVLSLSTAALLAFRFEAIRNWDVSKVTLMLHVASGGPPPRLLIAIIPDAWNERETPRIDPRRLKWITNEAEARPDGWISLQVPPSLVELLAKGKGDGLALRDKSTTAGRALNSREGGFTSYLIVEGQPRVN
jgi:hypothetical protein